MANTREQLDRLTPSLDNKIAYAGDRPAEGPDPVSVTQPNSGQSRLA